MVFGPIFAAPRNQMMQMMMGGGGGGGGDMLLNLQMWKVGKKSGQVWNRKRWNLNFYKIYKFSYFMRMPSEE